MSEQFIKLPKQILFCDELSPLEMRLLSVLLYWGGLNKKEPNHIKYGAEKLGKQIGVGRQACRRALLRLEELRFIDINHRGNLSNESYGISNDIELNIYRGIDFVLNGGSEQKAGNLYQNSTGYLSQKDAGDPHLNDTALYLNDTGVYLNDTGLCAIDLNKINLNKIHARARTKKATDDVASVRSMPCQQADDESARKEVVGSQCELTDYILVDDFKREFEDILPLITLFKIGNEWGVRPFMRLPERAIRAIEIRSFFEKRGQKITFFEAKTHKNGEIIMDLAIKTAS